LLVLGINARLMYLFWLSRARGILCCLLDGSHQLSTGIAVCLHEQGIARIQKLCEGEVGVSSSKSYSAFDEAAVFPRPGEEGDGCSVGRSLCTSTSQPTMSIN
jgi:hypothetical protein